MNESLYSYVLNEGAPVAMSTPYFLDGFEGYQNKSGLAPDTEKHATVLDIEPVME